GLIGEAVQPGNEAIKPWRQENQIAARLTLPINVRRNGGDEDPGFCGGGNLPRRKTEPPWSPPHKACFPVHAGEMPIGGTAASPLMNNQGCPDSGNCRGARPRYDRRI